MKCVLSAANVKLFAKAIHCLAKIGLEIYFEPLENGLALKTVNLSRSAYVCFLFMRTTFEVYQYECNDVSINGNEGETFKCKVAVKTLLQVFKSLSTIERSVESCDIDLDEDECRLIFQLKCRHGIIKTHQLTFQECESIQAVFAKDLSPNVLKCEHKLLNDVVANFSTSLEEMSLCVTPCSVILKSYTDSDDEASLMMRTEMCLNPEEFADFQIGVDTDITFSLKDLRAILAFCDVACVPIQLFFEGGGRPLIFTVEQDGYFRATFVLATIANDELSSQSKETGITTNISSNFKVNNVTQKFQARKAASKSKKASSAAPRSSSTNAPLSKAEKLSRTLHKLPRKSVSVSAFDCDQEVTGTVSKPVELQHTSSQPGDISPEIPNQNFFSEVNESELEADADQIGYQNIRKIFFAPTQADGDHTQVVLAPDSDEETSAS